MARDSLKTQANLQICGCPVLKIELIYIEI
jgi:hypothetical protein